MSIATALPASELLKAAEVCNIFRISRTLLLRWEQRGVITAVRIPPGMVRYRRDEVEILLAGGARAEPFAAKSNAVRA